jgi:hypothetical protein
VAAAQLATDAGNWGALCRASQAALAGLLAVAGRGAAAALFKPALAALPALPAQWCAAGGRSLLNPAPARAARLLVSGKRRVPR